MQPVNSFLFGRYMKLRRPSVSCYMRNLHLYVELWIARHRLAPVIHIIALLTCDDESGMASKNESVLDTFVYLFQVIAVGSFVIASFFFSVYGMAVDTLFLCFCKCLIAWDRLSVRLGWVPIAPPSQHTQRVWQAYLLPNNLHGIKFDHMAHGTQ